MGVMKDEDDDVVIILVRLKKERLGEPCPSTEFRCGKKTKNHQALWCRTNNIITIVREVEGFYIIIVIIH
jgi:hypothetical protein